MSTQKIHLARAVAVLALALAVPGLTTCRAGNGESLLIIDGLALTSQTQCTLRPGQGAQSIRVNGVTDLLLSNSYLLFPHFRNMMQPINQVNGEGPSSGQSEVHYIEVQGAHVWIDVGDDLLNVKGTISDGNGLPGGQESAAAAAADNAILEQYRVDGYRSYVAAGAAPSVDGVVAVQAIPPELGNILQKRMVTLMTRNTNQVPQPGIWATAFVTLEGYTQDGNKVLSNEFAFPILLCWRCLVKPNNPENSQTLPCIVGQDDGIDCPLCYSLGDPRWINDEDIGCPPYYWCERFFGSE